MATTDPLTAAYTSLCVAIFEHKDVAALVKPHRRIAALLSYRSSYQSLPYRAPADAPEVDIMPMGGSTKVSNTDWMRLQRFRVVVASQSPYVDQVYFPLMWAVYKALFSSGPTLGSESIRNVDILDSQETLVAPVNEEKTVPGLEGWVGVMAVQVTICLTRTTLNE